LIIWAVLFVPFFCFLRILVIILPYSEFLTLEVSINTQSFEFSHPTVGVSRLGWERGLAAETEKAPSHENAKKRGAYPKSAARGVGRRLLCKTD
jgi:hypothetical protein